MRRPLSRKLCAPLQVHVAHQQIRLDFSPNAISRKATACHYCHDIWVGELWLVLLPLPEAAWERMVKGIPTGNV